MIYRVCPFKKNAQVFVWLNLRHELFNFGKSPGLHKSGSGALKLAKNKYGLTQNHAE